MRIPVIDFSSYDEKNPQSLTALGQAVEEALTDIGFMSIRHLGIEAEELHAMFATSKAFFHQSKAEKQRCAYTTAEDNFGWQDIGDEHLDPGMPADLKETFTMRDPAKYREQDSRWPSAQFRDQTLTFYQHCLQAAFRVLRVFAAALGVERDFFVQYFKGENVTLRFLYYPDSGVEPSSPDQLGAGAHTDYGVITLLFQDDVGGLEVQDHNGQWTAVEYVEGAIVINTGDLMERWTNGRYKSTRHRVQPKIGRRERFSIAFFVDPDDATPVEVLPSCIRDDQPARFEPITAGQHILQKIRATHGNA